VKRDERLDRAIGRRRRGIWRATTAIVVVGVIALVWVWRSPERRRERVADRVGIGDDSAYVREALGVVGRRCPARELEHLRDRFASGLPPAALEYGMGRLHVETAERWVLPLEGEPARCLPSAGSTEIGLDASGRVLWIVPVTGRTPLRLPAGLIPADYAATDDG
jgi:hypothetical protein